MEEIGYPRFWSKKVAAVLRRGWGKKAGARADPDGWMPAQSLQLECRLSAAQLERAIAEGGLRYETRLMRGILEHRAKPGTYLPRHGDRGTGGLVPRDDLLQQGSIGQERGTGRSDGWTWLEGGRAGMVSDYLQPQEGPVGGAQEGLPSAGQEPAGSGHQGRGAGRGNVLPLRYETAD